MASYTVTTTDEQDQAIAFSVGRGQATSAAEFVQAVVAQALNDLPTRVLEQRRRDVQELLTQVDDTAVLGAVSALLEAARGPKE